MWTDLSSRLIDTAKSTLGLTREDDKTRYKKFKRLTTKAVAGAKSMAYDDMYEELHSKEGQNKIYRLAKQREKNSRDINGAPKVIKNKDGKLIIKEKEIMNR
ncbi:uncharacterized protein LOC135924438 [Gordionus sp. m RMFG-2023]|uniref:uncharacterized protein LOC135924438 n=1 Tax=Gordionus sp. m RMFG-2023 TaxID=3053472 RepID=UPI0031FD5CFD